MNDRSKIKGRRILVNTLVLALLLVLSVGLAFAQKPGPGEERAPQTPLSTGFTYQGQLKTGDRPVSDDCSMALRLYDDPGAGSQVGSAIPATVPISDGFFTVNLDFDGDAFAGEGRWLEIAVPGATIVVTSTADSGPGTLRQALQDAQNGDTVTFDPVVFPPTAPVTISITSELPHIRQGNLTIDASDAGVILDGSNLGEGWIVGLQIADSDGNTIRGLQVSNFSGRAIDISGDSQHNLIGGDRSVGAGPFGQGNLLIHNGNGVVMSLDGTTLNTITGNLIGTDAAGTSGLGNNTGIWIGEGANGNVIGPDNVIAHNGAAGIEVDGLLSVHNTITQNSIHDNGWAGIVLLNGGNTELAAPTIIDFDLEAGTVTGLACADCAVEIFSDDDNEGALYEGRTAADDAGYFTFTKGASFVGPHLTATATDASGNTSAFSAPAGAGQTIVVTSTADSGAGTLRQALVDAQSGDTITFDPVIFLPTAPVTISLTSELPDVHVSNLTIDASNAGVILDGSHVPGNWTGGLKIVSSHGNTIRGLQISHFGRAVDISGHSQYNVIGGDRSVGAGPFGQGNLLIRNGHGVVLSTGGTTLNTITGNLIGTNAAGVVGLGNRIGVGISEGANANVIGPDNVIAHNNYRGVELHEQGTRYNTITRNSIHDNASTGIELVGGNAQLAAPVILDFDLPAGTARGASCCDCTVEVFSDSGDEGGIYESTATADHTGVFTFSKGTPLIGPHLAATNTDLDGNTSQFSVPTSGTVGSLALQHGNHLPVTQFQARQSAELLDNRIGLGISQMGTPESWDLTFYPRGVKRARATITGLEPELVDWDRPEFSIDPGHDAVFTRMADNGLAITYVLMFWDKATWPGGVGAPCARFKTQEEIDRYLQFVEFIVHHFKDRVEYYELWNEPDIANYCPKWIELADYINLVKQTVPVIRAEYPEAKIVIGSVSNTRFGGYDYLLELLESDIMPLVDVISWHPMYDTSPEDEIYRDYWYQYPSMVQEIKDIATAHGFDGEYQAAELGWHTPGEEGDEPLLHSPTGANKYASRAIVMHLGLDVAVDNSVGEGATLGNLCTAMAGAEAAALPVQIQTTVTNTVSYTFALPNDDWLVALWTDGIAVEYDPGITTTVTLPGFVDHTATLAGFVDHTVTGIDVLHGFQQQLITSEENGNLVIRDLLVKDYPIILRLSSTKYVFLPTVLKGRSR